MTKEQFIKNNRMIAEFMDCKIVYENAINGDNYMRVHTYRNGQLCKSEHPEEDYEAQIAKLWEREVCTGYGMAATYHISWDMLMPVWFKIMDINRAEFGVYYQQEITPMFIQFKDKMNRGFSHVHLFSYDSENDYINAIYRAVVGFLEYYHLHKDDL